MNTIPELGAGVCKFGRNPEVDAAGVADVYDNGGDAAVPDYPWPAAAATTTIVGGANDVATTGTGAWTVQVSGLNADYLPVNETVTMTGATPVALTTEFLRVFRVKVLTAGTDGTNAANISIKHGTDVIAMITAGFGQSLMCIYTVPADTYLHLARWYGTSTLASRGTQEFRFDVRPVGGAWNCKQTVKVGGTEGAGFDSSWARWQRIDAKSDVRIRVFGGTDNNCIITAGFDLIQSYGVNNSRRLFRST